MATIPSPKTETKSISETRQHFSETLNRVYRGEARVVVEKSGIAVGAIVSVIDLDALKRIDEDKRQALQALADIQSGFADIPDDELEHEVAKAVSEAREIRHRQRQRTAQQSA